MFDKILVGMVLCYVFLYKDLIVVVFLKLLGDIISIEVFEYILLEYGVFFMCDWCRYYGLFGGFLFEKCCYDFDFY